MKSHEEIYTTLQVVHELVCTVLSTYMYMYVDKITSQRSKAMKSHEEIIYTTLQVVHELVCTVHKQQHVCICTMYMNIAYHDAPSAI